MASESDADLLSRIREFVVMEKAVNTYCNGDFDACGNLPRDCTAEMLREHLKQWHGIDVPADQVNLLEDMAGNADWA